MAFRAFAVQLDGVTGDVVFDKTTGRRAAGHPLVEKVLRWMRTPRGRALRDPSYGPDLQGLDNVAPNAAAVLEQRIRAGLKERFGAELLVERVTCDVQGGWLLWRVDLRDPRDPKTPLPSATGSF